MGESLVRWRGAKRIRLFLGMEGVFVIATRYGGAVTVSLKYLIWAIKSCAFVPLLVLIGKKVVLGELNLWFD